MNMEEMNNEGISLGDIFKMVWKKKILVAIITGVTLILVMLLMLFWYNPKKTTYTSEFDLSFTGSEEGKFPNGELFNYKDIISKENLLTVRDSKEEYKKINVENLFKKNAFKITKEENQYVVTLTGSKIMDEGLVANFIEDLINLNLNNVKSNLVEFDFLENLKAYESYSIYKDGIAYLIEQADLLVKAYDELVESYGASYTIKGKLLSSYRTEANNVINNINLQYLLSEAEKYLYVKDEAAKNNFHDYADSRVKSLLRQKNYNDKIIDEYKKMAADSSLSYTNYTEQMDKIARENATILIELEALCTTTDPNYQTYQLKEAEVANQSFKDKIDSAYKTIEGMMETLESNTKTANLNSLLFNWESNSIIVESGNMNIIVVILAGLVVGFVLGSVVALIIEFSKKDKIEENQEKEV